MNNNNRNKKLSNKIKIIIGVIVVGIFIVFLFFSIKAYIKRRQNNYIKPILS